MFILEEDYKDYLGPTNLPFDPSENIGSIAFTTTKKICRYFNDL